MKSFIKKRLSLAITLVLFVFGVMIASVIVVSLTALLLKHLGILALSDNSDNGHVDWLHLFHILLEMFGLCILLGTALTALLSKKALKPIRNVIVATHKVSEGDFSTRVDIKGSGVGELEELSKGFNKMAQELSSIETLRSDFVNNFSHEFKTPIVSIRGYAKLLKDTDLNDSERDEYIDIIIHESERLANLSTNILTLSKLEHLEIILDKSVFRLDEQIRRVIVLLEPKWSKKSVSLDLEIEDVMFNGNEDMMQQIWINLLDNAIKFCFQGGNIKIKLVNTRDCIVFTVQDDGCGMDAQTQAHVFDMFYQGNKSHAGEGNGLGLALAKRIVEMHDGEISFESIPENSTMFTVTLRSTRTNVK